MVALCGLAIAVLYSAVPGSLSAQEAGDPQQGLAFTRQVMWVAGKPSLAASFTPKAGAARPVYVVMKYAPEAISVFARKIA